MADKRILVIQARVRIVRKSVQKFAGTGVQHEMESVSIMARNMQFVSFSDIPRNLSS